MIDITKLTENEKGQYVVYSKNNEHKKGRIKSWNEKSIFVVYNCDDDWENYTDYTAEATRPEDLSFEGEMQ